MQGPSARKEFIVHSMNRTTYITQFQHNNEIASRQSMPGIQYSSMINELNIIVIINWYWYDSTNINIMHSNSFVSLHLRFVARVAFIGFSLPRGRQFDFSRQIYHFSRQKSYLILPTTSSGSPAKNPPIRHSTSRQKHLPRVETERTTTKTKRKSLACLLSACSLGLFCMLHRWHFHLPIQLIIEFAAARFISPSLTRRVLVLVLVDR